MRCMCSKVYMYRMSISLHGRNLLWRYQSACIVDLRDIDFDFPEVTELSGGGLSDHHRAFGRCGICLTSRGALRPSPFLHNS